MSKSQEVFKEHFKEWGEFAFCQDDDGNYTEEVTIKVFADWQVAKAYGRKQALEDVLAICKAKCDPHNTEYGNGYNRAALDCEKAIKELIK